jgi:hypothetical protein
MTTKTSDPLHASIAAGLVEANINFQSVVHGADDALVRAFMLTYVIEDREFTVYGYVADSVLVALVPLSVANDAKRHEMADAISRNMPLARLLPNPVGHPAPSGTTWIEAAVPLHPRAAGTARAAIPSWLAVAPFLHAAAAAKLLLSEFRDHVNFIQDASIPHFGTKPQDSTPVPVSGAPATMGADEAATPGQ